MSEDFTAKKNVEEFEKKFQLFRYKNDLLEQFTDEEVRGYLRAYASSGLEYDYGRSLMLGDFFREFPNTIWLPVIMLLLENFTLNEYGHVYTVSKSHSRFTKEDGTYFDYDTFHPGMQLIGEAFEKFPDLFKDKIDLLFLNNLSLYRSESLKFYEKYGNDFLDFFKRYVREEQKPWELMRAIIVMLKSGGAEMREFATQAIREKLVAKEDEKWMYNFLEEVGMDWTNNSLRELHSPKPLHIIFPENYFPEEKHENFTKALHPLPDFYKWGGWRIIKKPSGKKLKLQHLITLDPIPEMLAIKSVKRIEFVVNMDFDDGSGDYYNHNENGEIIIPEEHYWIYDGPDDYVTNESAFTECNVQLSDQGEEFRLQDWDSDQNINRIGGVPFFVQDYDYPECSCKRKMQFIMQLDSGLPMENDSEYNWGNGGVAYIHWCDDCRVSRICYTCT